MNKMKWEKWCLARDHTYITSAKGLSGWVYKMSRFADVQCCIYADVGGGSEKFQNCADVIYGRTFPYLHS